MDALERLNDVTRLDLERDWRDVSDEAIKTHQEYFTFADAEGCRFYFPAFMRQYLREFPYSGYHAVYWASTEPAKLASLTAAERACVDLFYNLCHEFPDHESAG